MSEIAPLVFCDFDGTIAQQDVGYRLYHHFSGGKIDALLPDWMAGRLTTRECLTREAEMVHASAEEIYDFVDQFTITPGFVEFVALCRSAAVPVVVISEGLDFYIHRLLASVGLEDLPVLCNIGHVENNSLRLEFPHRNKDCLRCGSCKAERIAEICAATGGQCRTIFVGDGYSDACAAGVADHLFAKKDLIQYCDQQKIPYTVFTDFYDIARQIEEQNLLATD